jgi:predicted nucleic acid-binding Zn ribbon protein
MYCIAPLGEGFLITDSRNSYGVTAAHANGRLEV